MKEPHPINVQIGCNLRKLRLKRGYTQEHCAKPLGITYQQWQKYECGANAIPVYRLLEAAKVLNTDIPTLLQHTSEYRFLRRAFGEEVEQAIERLVLQYSCLLSENFHFHDHKQ